MIRIYEIRLDIHQPKEKIPELIIKKLHIKKEDLLSYRIFKESMDARKSDMIYFSYCVDCEVRNEQKLLKRPSRIYGKAPDMRYDAPKHGALPLRQRPIVVGFGPAGMMAALLLAQEGYRPIVYERGGDVDERIKATARFWQYGLLDEEVNVQFGEGGAGTFSDGKLTTRVKDLRSRKVLEELVRHGAPEEILYEAHPHIGTDRLRDIVRNIREDIISLGGEIHFHAKVEDFQITDHRITGISVNGQWTACEEVILAIGHSARDTFRCLYERKVEMSAKAFAVGARIEHLQSFIDERQYGSFNGHPRLSAASYRFVHKASDGRGVYTFCMCPGGTVVASASSKEHLVVNGMSEYARDKANANSAVLVQVTPHDFGEHPLDGILYQEHLERQAFLFGQKSYQAPAQRVEDFLNYKKGDVADSGICPSYALGVVNADLHALFPSYIGSAMREGILAFDNKMPGFARDAVLTAPETRSSSPVRICRHEDSLYSVNTEGLYPCGEGAGYAGGIVSAAIDGIRCAEKIIGFHAKKRN